MDPESVDRALMLDARWSDALRRSWLTMADIAVFGALASSRIGALPKFRRRVLELGERLASLTADRAWIPQPRERLKNALASSRIAREAFDELERALVNVDRGTDLSEMTHRVRALQDVLVPELDRCEACWARLLEDDRRAARGQDDTPERD